MNPQDWLRGHELSAETAARFAYVATCLGVTVLLWRSSPLEPRVKRAAAAAGIMHFLASFAADAALVAHHQYRYQLAGLFWKVPIDLHLAWAALWGAGYCLLWERLAGWKRVAFYVAVVGGTLAWDALLVSQTKAVVAGQEPLVPVTLEDLLGNGYTPPPFGGSELWPWLRWDLALLACLPWLTLGWFYLVKNRKALLLRATLYALGYAVVFYLLAPFLVLRFQPDESWKDCVVSCPLMYDFGFGVHAFLHHMPVLAQIAIGLLSLLGAWAAALFYRQGDGTPLPLDPTRALVTSGPYAFVRNPMQISGVGVAVVLALAYRSWYLGFYAVDLFVLLCFLNAWEKAELARTFGEPYVRYAGAVRNWIPRLRPYRGI
ncbi:MAG: hypothetical protein KIS92_26360 [Planctomycetota bacterium]|nr:hypothetical protein [Planctomycetota bacterium]